MKKILCIGEALIDMICTDTNRSLANGEHFLKKAGGAPTNVAAAIAALGGQVDLIAKVGVDPFGKYLAETLTSFGVSTRYLLQDPRHFTTFAFVSLMESGERDFYFNRGADGQLTEEETSAPDLDEYSIVHFGSATAFLPGPLQAAYSGLLQRCLKKNVLISFDPNFRHLLIGDHTRSFIDQSWNFLEACHFFKLSEEEAQLLTGAFNTPDAARILQKKTDAVFAITLGKEGTLLGCGEETRLIPSIPVKSVDSTGAGDAFTGAVLFQLNRYAGLEAIKKLDSLQWGYIVQQANKAGARTCEFLGAMEAFKHLNNEILK